MILVTGGTGFIGRNLIRQLVALGYPVRTLLYPSQKSPNLPKGVAVEAAVSSLRDERGLMAALKGVDYVFHLAGSERDAIRADLNGLDIQGTRTLVLAAEKSRVKQIFYLSHLGADQNSAYSVLKAKALAEKAIQQSGIPYSIFRSSHVYGPGDQFLIPFARLIKMSPGFFLLPGDGSSALQPLWIDDLIASLIVCLQDATTLNEIIEVAGGEVYTFREIIELILHQLNISRTLLEFPLSYLRILAIYLNQTLPKFPVSLFWLDTLAEDRTTSLDILPRRFGIIPARLSHKIDYLSNEV
jgi:NADH dehydrogenase